MPLLTIPLVPGGAFLDVGVGAPGLPTTPATWRALIDTGADMTAISPAIVAALAPQRLGTIRLGRAGGGSAPHATYVVRVRFGGHAGPGRWFAVEAVEARPATPGVDLLIGMDLLLRIDMHWEGARRLLLLSH